MVGKAGLKFADEVVGGGGGEDKVDRERLLRVKELEELGKGAGVEGLRGLVIPLVAVVCGGRLKPPCRRCDSRRGAGRGCRKAAERAAEGEACEKWQQ